jgi:dishevelled associated activator of morphogenesis
MEDHLDFFEMMRKDDEEELASSTETSSINLESVTSLAEALNRKLDKSVAQKHLLSILEHMLILSLDENHIHLWKLYDLVLQQLSLQMRIQNVKDVGNEVDAALAGQSLGVDMDRIMAKLRSEQECQRLERECMEKDKKIVELENRLSDLQDGFSLSSFSRSSDLGSSSSSEPCHSPTPSSATFNSSVSKSNIPPAPPIPPPLPNQLKSLGGPLLNSTAPKKKVPKPIGQLKSLNWTTIPHTKINNTIWENMNEEKMYEKVSDKTFFL